MSPNPVTSVRPEIAEAIGVFFLVLAGCGAAATEGGLAVALTFAFVILVLVYALGHVCGAHFNPAITIAFATMAHFPWRRVPSYVAAQIIGAIAAALTLRWIFAATPGLTIPSVPLAAAFAVEFLATFLLAFVIVAVATDRRAPPAAAGLAIGLAVGVGALFAGALTGGSMNPARTLGPAIAAGSYGALWVYLSAPILGAIAAMATYEWLRPAQLGIRAREPLGALGPIDGLEARE